MGDRGNITIRQDQALDRIFLYTHWGGSEIGSVLQRALGKRWRWDDPAYLARIIFDELTDGKHGEETGYGISLYAPDNEHLILDVETTRATVSARNLDGGRLGEAIIEWTFEEFLRLPDPNYAVMAGSRT